MTPPPASRQASATWWEGEGRRIAGQLRDVSALLVAGASTEHAALVALGIARAESERRHVALGDLTGDAAPLYAVAGGEDAFGLSDCLRQDLPLNDVARPAPDCRSLFILPAGTPPVACEEILAHERWPRLVNGFAEVGALLLLVVPAGAPGFATLAAATGGTVLVETAAGPGWNPRVLATIASPGPPLPPARTARGTRRGRRAFAILAFAVTAFAIAAVWHDRSRIRAAEAGAATRRLRPLAAAPHAADPATATAVDTVRLTDPVNPADTSGVAPFAVEVMAANTPTGANSFLSDHAGTPALDGATLSPVAVGGSSALWYKVVAGASHSRTGADSLLAALRRDGLVGSGQGRVVNVPYALVLTEGVDRSAAPALLDEWRRRGFNAYALVQQDGRVSLLAGAFETTAQAAPLASALRKAGVAPVVVFRIGRTY